MSRETAARILNLLNVRSDSDIFVTECKTGPTWFGGHRRLDAWSMNCSWSNNKMIGYEIKVSRSDFLADKKWCDYLPVCTQFYFVCPSGLIQADEIEGPAGLLWMSKTGNVLRTKRAAKLLKPEAGALVVLMQYILMNRCKITDRPAHGTHRRESAYERSRRELSWLRLDRRKKRVGHALAKVYALAKAECHAL